MAEQRFQLKAASLEDCLSLRQNFNNLAEVTLWGGEGYTFPLQKHAFLQKLMLPDTQSYVLFREHTAVGFGQICDRFGRHHLARLLIFPKFRQQGLSQCLIQGLLLKALAQNKRLDFSLYVFLSNQIAIQSYTKIGFQTATQPGVARDDLAFMTLDNAQGQHYVKQLTSQAKYYEQILHFSRQT